MFYGGAGSNGTGSSGAFIVRGDNNSFSGIGNNMEASGGSTVNSPFSLSNSYSWSTNNRNYSLGGETGTVTDVGVVDPVDNLTVTDE